MRNLPTFLLGICLVLSACGGPQPVGDLDGDNTNKNQSNVCSFGAGGPDSDSDGVPDACEEKIGTPANNPDCDHDGISDSLDDPKDCQANPTTECDQYCQERKRAIWQAASDSLALGGSSVGGKTYPGVNTVIKKNILFFANPQGNFYKTGLTAGLQNQGVPLHRLSEALCKSKGANFYLYTLGDIGFSEIRDTAGNIISAKYNKTNVNFEICGKMEGVSTGSTGITNLGPAKITVFFYGTTAGAIQKTALVDEANQGEATFTLTKTATSINAYSCSGTTADVSSLWDKMQMTLTNSIKGTYDQLVSPSGTPIIVAGNIQTVEKLYDKWKRPVMGANCDRIIPESYYGVAGMWVKDGWF